MADFYKPESSAMHAMQGVEDTSPSCLQGLSGPPFSLPTAGSSFPSPVGTSLLLTAPLLCQPPAPPRRQLPTTTWCTTCTVMTSSEAGPQSLQEAESALSAEITVSLQQMLTSAQQQQQQATLSSLACQDSQPISSPEELLSRLSSGQLVSVTSSDPGCISSDLGCISSGSGCISSGSGCFSSGSGCISSGAGCISSGSGCISSRPGCICGSQEDSSLCEGSIDITDDAVSSLLAV